MESEISPSDNAMQPDPADCSAVRLLYFDAISDAGGEALVFTIEAPAAMAGFDAPAIGVLRANAELTFFAGSNRVLEAGCNAEIRPDGKADTPATCVLELAAASYGVGYMLRCRLPKIGGGELFAELEWLFVSAGAPADRKSNSVSANANPAREIVAVRADVSGRISAASPKSPGGEVFHFRGTGYSDRRSLIVQNCNSPVKRIWARTHFADCTMIFESASTSNSDFPGELLLTDESTGNAVRLPATSQLKFLPFSFGRRFSLVADAGEYLLELSAVKLLKNGIAGSFFLCECRLRGAGGHRGLAICEMNPGFSLFPALRNSLRLKKRAG